MEYHDGEALCLCNVRAFAVWCLAQKTRELTTERHYSPVAHAQSKNRGSMPPELFEKRGLLRAEVLQVIVIAESAGKTAVHHSKTVDETAKADEAAGTTPDALDETISGLFGRMS